MINVSSAPGAKAMSVWTKVDPEQKRYRAGRQA